MGKDGKWKKEPGRLKIAFHTKKVSESEIEAEKIVKTTALGEYQRKKIVTSLAKFIEAYDQLQPFIHTNKGNVPVAEDSIELRNNWHSYLFKGRELIDEVGSVINVCFGLKQKVSGLNEKKFKSLKNIVTQAMRKKDFSLLLEIINENEENIVQFVNLRNREKSHADTLIDPPVISEEGIPSGGSIKGINISFSDYIQQSYLDILKFVESILSNRT